MSDLLVTRSDVGEFRKRYKYFALVVFIAFAAVIVRLFQLQIMQGDSYAGIAHENIIRRVTISTTRGVIRDSQGKILASSRPAYNVYIVPGRVMPSARPVRRNSVEADEPDSWPRIAETLRLNPDERARIDEKIRSACANDATKSPCWRQILVREDIARDTVAELKQHQAELPGAEVVSSPVRYYPFKNLASHALGYVTEIDAETLARFRPEGYESMSTAERQKVNPLGYEAGDAFGATGIERAFESTLRGQRGWEKRVVDAHGRYRTGPEADRLIDAPARQEPIPGRDLRITIDIELEQAIERAMRAQLAGAAVVIDVRTGRLLGLYSKPDFDPNDLSGGGGKARLRETFKKLYADPLRPMLDKAISGAFQPGSTFKAFTALAGLENRAVNPEERERCDSYYYWGRRFFHCMHVHGKVNMREAIAESCNIYFFKLAQAVTMDQIAVVAREFGLGVRTGIGVNPEASGRIPTHAWYALRYRGQFRGGFTLNTAIGQGDTTVTPLQLGLAYAALANGGTLYLPQIVRTVEASDGSVEQDFPPRVRQKVKIAPENLSRVNDALWSVVNDPKGTAYGLRDDFLEVSGKTGTAQNEVRKPPDDDPKKAWYYAKDHAWFVSYYPSRAPEIAVVVLVEHGGAGPTIAAPIAINIIRDYARIAATRAGRPPPRTSKSASTPGAAPAARAASPANVAAAPAPAPPPPAPAPASTEPVPSTPDSEPPPSAPPGATGGAPPDPKPVTP
ncbi:penicillin-binding protein 2 [Pendulispora albinea]|uniref:Penicillin-binding protein 2 n=1 Tax=Pendulispora albinea TaxID=2741071 RepID=A0ABZ2LN49_9BACT